MAAYETEYGNFAAPEDILRYMQTEGVDKVHITLRFCGGALGKKNFEMDVADVKKWIDMGNLEEVTKI